jgi:hypothetical protein
MHQSQHQAPSEFTLNPGDRITGCVPLWSGGSDRVLQEIANCSYCLHPTYRVVVITSAGGLERRAALCVRHFTSAARVFPELKRLSA